MSRIHDMGGRLGDGPVVSDAEAPVFEEDWHARALALTLAAGALGQWNLDMSRFARENLTPRDYARFSYYEKWLAGLADLMVQTGVVRAEELAGGSAAPSTLAAKALPADVVPKVLARGAPVSRAGPAPRFSVGDRVRTVSRPGNGHVQGGHTRLPRYAAGVLGQVILSHGCHVFPDTHAHGQGERPQPLYTVLFDAGDLWAMPERAGDEVTCDLWEGYLEAAN